MLELEQVHKYYSTPGETVRAVDGVSLSVEAGELVAINGPSGSGKTSLLLLAAGLLQPDQGTVRFRGTDLTTLSENQSADCRRENFGFIYQTFNLIPGLTAVENVAVPLMLGGLKLRDARQEAMAMIETVGLEHRADHRPSHLSGGERQRVAIARALVGKPSLVLADEPTGNLDTERGDQVLSLLGDLCRDRDVAVILVTHDERAAAYADRILRLRDGKLSNHNSRQKRDKDAMVKPGRTPS